MTPQLKIITQIEQAESVWKALSPNKYLYDLWDFRLGFYRTHNSPLRFYTIFNGKDPIAVLPLQYRNQNLDFFGTGFMENNRIFFKSGYQNQLDQLIQQVPAPYKLETMDILHLRNKDVFELEDYQYVLSIKGFSSIQNYLESIKSSKLKKNLHQIKKKLNPHISIIQNHTKFFHHLSKINISRFQKESAFYDGVVIKALTKAVQIPNLNFDQLLYQYNNKIVGASLGVKFNSIYYYLSSSPDINQLSGIGHYIHLQNIERAIQLSCLEVDAGFEDLGWKQQWQFSPIPQYKLK